jgi:predicted enzyme involved in methoxymalonyl-ACP biosynthesis
MRDDIDDIQSNWKPKVDAGIMLKRNLYLNTLIFADDQVIIQDSEDRLQKSVYILNQLSKDYNLKISTDK